MLRNVFKCTPRDGLTNRQREEYYRKLPNGCHMLFECFLMVAIGLLVVAIVCTGIDSIFLAAHGS